MVEDSGANTDQHGVDVGAALSWIHSQLVFERRPLGEVADEFNRYNRDRIVMRGDALRGETVSGVFQYNDIASFVAFLRTSRMSVSQRTAQARTLSRGSRRSIPSNGCASERLVARHSEW
jgi:ferric-dicitrate binding protein FerR (iron transport regulator)